MAPQTQFVLLTQAASHEELAALDGPNVRRRLIRTSQDSAGLRPRLLRATSRMLAHLPTRRLQRVASRVVYRISTVFARRRSCSILDDIGADLLFCPFTAPTYFHPRIPTVCTIYDLQYKAYPEFFTPEDVAHRDRSFVEASRKASRLAAISDFSRDAAIAAGSLDSARIKTIYLRMAQRTLVHREPAGDVVSRLGLVNQRYLVYPANFWQHKNHEMLFVAFGMACAQGLPGDVKLLCTGSPGDRQIWLAKAVTTMGLGERIVFPGFLPTEDFSALIAHCCGIIFPSLYEGFGLPVIEAMAAGKPVACSDNTSLREVAGDAAILFNSRIPTEIAAAIISLTTNEDLRTRLVQKGLKRAAEFSDSRRMASEYLNLFYDALNGEFRETLLTGTYEDGWAGPNLMLQVVPTPALRTVEIELFAPEWIPARKLKVKVNKEGSTSGALLVLRRGGSAVYRAALPAEGGRYEIEIFPSFVPARTGHGQDHRELSALLKRCTIVQAGGQSIELTRTDISA
ncbi:glycosyltransferase family 4 protein [Parapusillimonas sp. SGNA-6]|nr:glycosyltransferase family 4 protein [Parapusillimonas sp. SGNA-6]